MGILVSLIIGGIVGWLGSIVMKTNAEMGPAANVMVGIIGAVIGSWLGGLLGVGGAGVMEGSCRSSARWC